MPFTEEEIRQWREEKRRREQEPPRRRPEPVATCVHCQQPFGFTEGTITEEVAICDICNGD